MRVAEDVTVVKAPAHRRGRGVYREDLFSGLAAIESIDAVALPAFPPFLLETIQRRFLRDESVGIWFVFRWPALSRDGEGNG